MVESRSGPEGASQITTTGSQVSGSTSFQVFLSAQSVLRRWPIVWLMITQADITRLWRALPERGCGKPERWIGVLACR
jgi:hypothetical protein